MTDKRKTAAPLLWSGWARKTSLGKWWLLIQDAPSEAEALQRLRIRTSYWRYVDLCALPAGRGPPGAA